MKYKTLFRMGQKLVGLLVIGQGAGALLSIFASLAWWLFDKSNPYGTSYTLKDWYPSLVQPCVEVGIGLYLFIGGRWIADIAIPSNRPYCHECGYDLNGTSGHICPECGTEYKAPVTTMIDGAAQ